VKFTGYGADADFDGATLHLVARNAITGNATLGARERHVPVTEIVAVSFRAANMLTNGALTVQVGGAKYQVHFLRKAGADARAVYEAVLATSNADPSAVPVGKTPIDSLDAVGARLEATAARLDEAATQQRDADAERRAAAATSRQERAAVRRDAALERASAREQATADRGDAKTARAQARDDKRAAKVAAAEAEAAVIAAFSAGMLAEYTAQHGLAKRLENWTKVDAHLAEAGRHAAVGRITAEERALRAAVTEAKTLGGRSMRKTTEQRVDAGNGRHWRIGSSWLGRVEAEDAMSQSSRKGSLLKAVTAEKWIEVRSDRVITPTDARPVDSSTSAQVYLNGQAQVTTRLSTERRLSVTKMVGLSLNPTKTVLVSKRETTDSRHAEFHVGGLGWSLRATVHPDRLAGPRQMAEQINRRASEAKAKGRQAAAELTAAAPAPAPAPDAPDAGDTLSRLERVQALRESGTITDDEADALKQAILSD
jgi:hypothetical protein